jgi:hypothetical protein
VGGPGAQRATSGGGGAVGNTPITGVASGRAQQRAAFVQAQTNMLPTFNDLGVDIAPAATTVKVYLSPLNGGLAEELIEASESMIAITTYNFLKANFKFNEQGVLDVENGTLDHARFAAIFPEGPRAFSASKDQKEVTGQVAALVAAQFIEAAVVILRFFRFNVFITGGRLKTKTGYAVAVEASQGRGRRKQNVLPADVVRGLSLQVTVPAIGVTFDKDDHPGERLFIMALTDEQFDAAHQGGGYRLLGDKRYLPFPYTPRAGKQKLYMHTSMHSIEAVEHDAVPQLAGWLGVAMVARQRQQRQRRARQQEPATGQGANDQPKRSGHQCGTSEHRHHHLRHHHVAPKSCRRALGRGGLDYGRHPSGAQDRHHARPQGRQHPPPRTAPRRGRSSR